jgi:hypothetical protein
MDKRKDLHDYSLVLIFLSILDVFSFFARLIASIVNGTVSDALATVESDILGAVQIVLVVFVALMTVIALSEAFIGIKGLKVAQNPSADKGYIVAAKILCVLSVIAAASFAANFFGGNVDIVTNIFNLVNSVLDVVVFVLFIQVATSVRSSVLASK